MLDKCPIHGKSATLEAPAAPLCPICNTDITKGHHRTEQGCITEPAALLTCPKCGSHMVSTINECDMCQTEFEYSAAVPAEAEKRGSNDFMKARELLMMWNALFDGDGNLNEQFPDQLSTALEETESFLAKPLAAPAPASQPATSGAPSYAGRVVVGDLAGASAGSEAEPPSEDHAREIVAAWHKSGVELRGDFGYGDLIKRIASNEAAAIRKGVAAGLEEAFLVRPGLASKWDSAQQREGYYAGLEAFRQAIRKLDPEAIAQRVERGQ